MFNAYSAFRKVESHYAYKRYTYNKHVMLEEWMVASKFRSEVSDKGIIKRKDLEDIAIERTCNIHMQLGVPNISIIL